MTRYAGFWPRLSAGLIDFLVLVPFIGLGGWAIHHSYTAAVTALIPLAILFASYNIYFIGRWGQTVGKMAMKIRVVTVAGQPAGFTRALSRHSVDLVFSIIQVALTISEYLSVASAEYDMLDLRGKAHLLRQHEHPITSTLGALNWLWIASELIVLLFNEKRRAIHDFLGGTVVIHTEAEHVAA